MSCATDIYEKWTIELYKKNLKEYSSKIKSLKVIVRDCKTDTSFWNVKTKELQILNYELDPPTAKILMHQHSCIKENGGRELNKLINDFECNYKWMSTVEQRHSRVTTRMDEFIATHHGYLSSPLGSLNGL